MVLELPLRNCSRSFDYKLVDYPEFCLHINIDAIEKEGPDRTEPPCKLYRSPEANQIYIFAVSKISTSQIDTYQPYLSNLNQMRVSEKSY